MYEQPTKGDLDRNLSTIFHSAHQKARAERGRLTSEFAARGMATSTSLIGAMIGVLDTIHKDAIGQAMPLLRDFAERMQIPAIEITALARPHLENLGSSVLGQLPPAGFPEEHQRIRAQYTAVFQQRLDGALRDFEIGFIGGRNIGVQAKGDDSIAPPPSTWTNSGGDVSDQVVRMMADRQRRFIAATQSGAAETPLVLRVTPEPTASTAPKIVELSAATMLKISAGLTPSVTVPEQSPAPVVVEERNGKIARISDRDSPLSATEEDFNGWRKPVLDHVQQLLFGDFPDGTNHSRVRDRLIAIGGTALGEYCRGKGAAVLHRL